MVQQYDEPNIQERVQVNPVKLPSNVHDIHTGKVIRKMILVRIDENINAHIQKKQFKFRTNRKILDVICIVREIMESKQHILLHFNLCGLQCCIWHYLERCSVEGTSTAYAFK